MVEYAFIAWDYVVQRNRIIDLMKDRFYSLGEQKEQLFDIIDTIKPDVIHIQEFPEYFMDDEIARKLYDKNREYVITNPKTPYPWINYLGNEDFFSLTSNTGGGYTFYKDAKFRRLTRYRYNNVPVDDGGKYFYIKDGDTVWSPGWKPVKTELDSYECRHGMSYTKIKGSKNGVSTEVLQFIPLGFWGEIQKVTISNDSSEVKKLKLFSFIEWCLWNAEDDMTNFQRNFNTGEVEVEDSVIYHKTEFKERRNHYAFYSVNNDIQGFDTDRESFVGLYNGFEITILEKLAYRI